MPRKKQANPQDFMTNEEALAAMNTMLSRRQSWGEETFEGERNVWAACGYPVEPSLASMELRYARGGIAKAIVEAYPDACWEKPPTVEEDGAENIEDRTKFEKAWDALWKRLLLANRFKSIDIMAGRGQFTLLLLGFDSGTFAEPVSAPANLVYVRPFLPCRCTVKDTEKDPNNERYGQPTLFEVTITPDADGQQEIKKTVHWTRAMLVADNTDEKEWEGRHRLHNPFNNILNLEKISGGASEGFWKVGFPDTALIQDKETGVMTASENTAIDDAITDMKHGLTRWLKLRGITPKVLTASLQDPTQSAELELKQISAGTGIPTRKLVGSEQAQLASEQDTNAWIDRVEARREAFCGPMIVAKFIEHLLLAGTLPPVKGFNVTWPTLKDRSPKEMAETAKLKTETLTIFADSANSEAVLPLFHFLVDIMGYDEKEAKEIADKVELEDPQPTEEEQPPADPNQDPPADGKAEPKPAAKKAPAKPAKKPAAKGK